MVELKAGEVLRGDQGLEIKLIKEIGEGSFAKVFEAVETESQLIVAAKFFNEVCPCSVPSSLVMTVTTEVFLKTAQMMQQAAHPSVARSSLE